MFDTKHYYGCECPKVFCYHRYPEHPFETARETILYKESYNRGYYEGRRDAWNEFERETDQEKFAKLLQEAMHPLEDLLKEFKS
jgi:hypothetical protein